MKLTFNASKSANSFRGMLWAYKYLKDYPKLLRYISIPIIINLFIFPSLSWGTYILSSQISKELLSKLPHLSYLEINIFQFTSLIATILLVIEIFISLSMIINGPIYRALKNTILKDKGLVIKSRGGFIQFILNIMKELRFETQKLTIYFSIFLLSSILNIFPIIGSKIFVVINIIVFIILNGLTIFGPCFYQQKSNFKNNSEKILKSPLTIWPHIFVSGVMNSIPLLNIITLPLSTLGGILIYIEYIYEDN